MVFEPQADVEFALALRQVDQIVAPGVACDGGDGAVEDGLGEQRLEQRVAAQVTLRMQRRDQLLERQLGMIERTRHGVAYPRQDGVEVDVTADLGTQHQAVQEQALHIGQLGPVAAGHRCADDHVGLAGVARQQALEQRQQCHEHRGLAALRQGPQTLGQRRRQRHGDRRTAATGHRGARQIGVQIQHQGHAGQLRAPPTQLFGQHGALQPGTLPDRVVGVLDRQFRQPGFATGLRRGAQFTHLADQCNERPAVGSDMVDRHAQCAAPARQAEQQRPPHTTGQVEGLPAFGSQTRQRGGGEALVGHLAQVDHRQGLPGRRLHPLVRLACAHAIGGSQHLVAVDHCLDRLRQHLGGRFDDGAQLQVERTTLRVELVQEPHPLLIERQRQFRWARESHQRRPRRCRFAQGTALTTQQQLQRRALFRRQCLKSLAGAARGRRRRRAHVRLHPGMPCAALMDRFRLRPAGVPLPRRSAPRPLPGHRRVRARPLPAARVQRRCARRSARLSGTRTWH